MAALSGGHLATDFASGSVPALIPFLTDRFQLGYALAAMLLLAATVSSSLVQPLFGLWSDRRGARWLIPMHYGSFRLSHEPLDEPLRLLAHEARAAGVQDRLLVLQEGVTRMFG